MSSFLQVVSLSDISTGKGDQIDPRWIREPRADLPSPASFSRSNFEWPVQQGPPPSDWAIWKSCISKAWCSSFPLLSRPLRNWLETPDTILSDWDWFVSQDHTTLYHFTLDRVWYQFSPVSARSRNRFRSHTQQPCPHPPNPSCVFRCTVEDRYGTISVSHSDTSLVEPPPVSSMVSSVSRLENMRPSSDISTTLQDVLLRVNDASWICEWFHCSSSLSSLLVDLVTGQAVAVSDGSFYPDSKRASAAWIIASHDGKEFIKGGGLVPGPLLCHSAYRSELAGLLGIAVGIFSLHTVAQLYDFYPPPSVTFRDSQHHPSIVIGCDGLSALNRCFHNSIESTSLTWQQFDLITAVVGWWSALPFRPCHTHVKGHQEKHTPLDQLTLLEWLNVDMDYFAKSIILGTNHVQHPSSLPTMEFGAALVFFRGEAVTSDLENSLYHALTSRPLLDHWNNRFSLSTLAVDWPSFGNARSNSSRARQHFISKWLSGHVGLGKVLIRRGHSVFHRCPRCNLGDDTELHCLTCPKASSLFSDHMDKLAVWLADQKTHPSIIVVLPLLLGSWFRQHRSFSCSSLISAANITNQDDGVTSAIWAQQTLGFDKLFYGFISPQWVQVQDAYYVSIASQRTGFRWASRFIRYLWDILFSLWTDRSQAKFRLTSVPTHSICPPSRLRRFAIAEFRKGHDGLVPFLRSYFSMSETRLLEKSPSDLRLWLHAVICGREREDPAEYDSPFLTDRPLRSWLGLRLKPPPEPPPPTC